VVIGCFIKADTAAGSAAAVAAPASTHDKQLTLKKKFVVVNS
jgi:hypothetical protein